MIKNKLKNIALSLAVIMGIGLGTPTFAKSTYNSGDILALGSDLTKAQEKELREFFNAPDGTKTIYVTDEIIIEQLGLDPNDPDNYAGGCYSSAYVQLLDNNDGIVVDARNLTEVTESMLMNALITSGITSAKVKVSAPFKVTGTSALSGILAGVEEVGGFEISLKKKETAQKEIETTMEIAEEVGQEEASTIINDIKTEVIKEKPKTEEEVEKIVEKVTNEYNINISDNSKDSLVVLMNDVNDLDLNYDELKTALDKAGDKLKDNLKELGIKLKDEGFFEKIGNFLSDLWDKFLSLFNNKDKETSIEPIENNGVDTSSDNDENNAENDENNIDNVENNVVNDESNSDDKTTEESNDSNTTNDEQIKDDEQTENDENSSQEDNKENAVDENIETDDNTTENQG